MIYRGSLRQCIQYLGTAYKITNEHRLIIVQRPKAKYYCLLTDVQAHNMHREAEEGSMSVVFRGTIAELTAFTTAIPVSADLFDDTAGSINAHDTDKD